MKSNSEIVKAWISGKSAKNRNMSTDGFDIKSYNLIIGYTDSKKKIGLDFTSRNNHFISVTTSRHVSHVMYYADEMITDFSSFHLYTSTN